MADFFRSYVLPLFTIQRRPPEPEDTNQPREGEIGADEQLETVPGTGVSSPPSTANQASISGQGDEVGDASEAVLPDPYAGAGTGVSPTPPPPPAPQPQPPAAANNQASDTEIGHLKKRIQASPSVDVLLAAGILVPMAVEHSNSKKPIHTPTVFWAFVTILCNLLLSFVQSLPIERPARWPYIVVKTLIHACALLLVSLSFSLSLMMNMNAFVTRFIVAVTMAVIVHRWWQCVTTELGADLEAYRGCEEELQKLLELSGGVKSMLFGGWFGMAYFYFQINPEEVSRAGLLPSEYLIFSMSVAASLVPLKAVPRNLVQLLRPVDELRTLVCVLMLGVMMIALTIAASKVGGYAAALALLPEAVALAAWARPSCWPEWLRSVHGGEHGEPPPHNVVSAAMALLLAVLTYHVKANGGDVDVGGGMSGLYDEGFVLLSTAAVVAALAWMMVTLWAKHAVALADQAGVQTAAKTLSLFTFCLLALSMLAFLGVMFGL